MEKQFVRPELKFCKRLLASIQFFLYASFLFCAPKILSVQAKSSKQNELQFSVDENESFLTDTDIIFSLELKGVSPEKLDVTLPDFSAQIPKAKLRSFTKNAYQKSRTDGGTNIRIILRFNEAGQISIPPVQLVNGRKTSLVYFPSLYIKKNPIMLNPVLIVKFKDGSVITSDADSNLPSDSRVVPVNNNADFSLFLKYAVSFSGLQWELPKNSLFECVENYESKNKNIKNTEADSQDFSDDSFDYEYEIPVADFRWTIPANETVELSGLGVNAKAFSGEEKTVLFNPFSVKFSRINADKTKNPKGRSKDNSAASSGELDSVWGDDADNLFNDTDILTVSKAFDDDDFAAEISDADCILLAKKLSFRKKIILTASLLFSLILAVFSIIFFHKKRYLSGVLFMIAFAVFTYIFIATVSHHTGVYIGGAVSSIPAENTRISAEFEKGSVVVIKGQAGEWLLVSQNNNSGWCTQDSVIFVK